MCPPQSLLPSLLLPPPPGQDAIVVESLVGDWGFEVGAEKIYFRLSPPPEQWMQKRLHLWLEIGDLKSLAALGALWELSGSSPQLRV